MIAGSDWASPSSFRASKGDEVRVHIRSAFCAIKRFTPLAKPEPAEQWEKAPVVSFVNAPPCQFPTWIVPKGPAAKSLEESSVLAIAETNSIARRIMAPIKSCN
jgi:hypothetical protein